MIREGVHGSIKVSGGGEGGGGGGGKMEKREMFLN